MIRRIAVAFSVVLAASACGGGDDEGATPQVPISSAPSQTSPTSATEPSEPASKPDLTPRTIVEGLEVPWGIAFLPDGSALIAERDVAAIQHLSTDGKITEVGEVAGVVPTSEGGLLGLAVSPSYESDHTIYAYFTTESDNRGVSMSYEDGRLGRADPILTGIPAGQIHDGGRIAFGPDGKLYVTTGETGSGELAQDPDSLGGKILRLEPDGSIPEDNPDPESPVWTLGHRNVQGITWDDDGRMWASEFGASTWDELNLIEKGNNYGWPAAEGKSDLDQFTNPVRQWSTDDLSPSGIAYLDGSLYIAGLRGQRLYRIPIRADGSTGQPEALYEGDYGRLRSVVATPDGRLWFSTSNRDGRGEPIDQDDRIFEIRP
jgi:glucose/arabinose dehydrogenase